MAYRVEAVYGRLAEKPKIRERGMGSFLYPGEYRRLMKQQAEYSIYDHFECKVIVFPNATVECRDKKTGELRSTGNSAILRNFLKEREEDEEKVRLEGRIF